MTSPIAPRTQDSSLTSSTSPVEKSSISGFFESVKSTTIRIFKFCCSSIAQLPQQIINLIKNFYNILVKRSQNPETHPNNSVHQDLGIAVNAKDENSMTPSMKVVQEDPEIDAIRKCGSEMESKVRAIQKSLETASVKDEKKMTPSKEIVPKELETDVNAEDANGMTPLMKAAQTGDIIGVNKLFGHNIDVNAKNNNGETALICASKVGGRNNKYVTECIAALVKRPDIDLTIADNNGTTALMHLVDLHDIEGIRLLMGSGKDVAINAQNKSGFTALMFAALISEQHGIDALTLLFEHPDIDAALTDQDGYTALMYRLTQRAAPGCVELLIERSAGCINKQSSDMGQTALMLAIDKYPCHLQRLLEVPGIDLGLKDDYGTTALDFVKQRYEPYAKWMNAHEKRGFEKAIEIMEQRTNNSGQ